MSRQTKEQVIADLEREQLLINSPPPEAEPVFSFSPEGELESVVVNRSRTFSDESTLSSWSSDTLPCYEDVASSIIASELPPSYEPLDPFFADGGPELYSDLASQYSSECDMKQRSREDIMELIRTRNEMYIREREHMKTQTRESKKGTTYTIPIPKHNNHSTSSSSLYSTSSSLTSSISTSPCSSSSDIYTTESSHEVKRFFQFNATPPAYYCRVIGTRDLDKPNTQPHLQDRSLDEAIDFSVNFPHTQKVEFSFKFDLTRYLAPSGVIRTRPDPLHKELDNCSIEQIFEMFASLDDGKSASLRMYKQVVGVDENRMRQAIVWYLRNVRKYTGSISVYFEMGKQRVALKKETMTSRALHSKPAQVAKYMTGLGVFLVPVLQSMLERKFRCLDCLFDLSKSSTFESIFTAISKTLDLVQREE
eukprot:Nk52_evm26s262 gene=Nk52_evmTU26s262